MIFLLKVLLWTLWMQFWHSCEKSFDKIQSFFLQCPTMIKNCNLHKKKSYTKRSSGDAEFSSDNTIDKISKKPGKNYLKIRKKEKL